MTPSSNAVPTAFNPNTGLIHTTSWNLPRLQKLAPPKPQVLGADPTGVLSRPPTIKSGDVLGHFVAINPLTDAETGNTLWQFKSGSSINSTALTFTHKASDT
jgi:hypothetical protein